MTRIKMKSAQKESIAQIFDCFLAAAAARGVREKTLTTYKQHFHAISKRVDASAPIAELKKDALDTMILSMRTEGLSDKPSDNIMDRPPSSDIENIAVKVIRCCRQ